MYRSSVIIVSLLASACAHDRLPPASSVVGTPVASAAALAPEHIDSAIPRDVALERFREGTTQVAQLAGGARSRDALVHAWVRAIETSDTASLERMLITRDEFAWLIYPTAPQGLPPYDLSPSLMWFTVDGSSRKDFVRLMQDRGGKPMHVAGYGCDATPSHQGENTVWGPCSLKRVQATGDTLQERLFSLIVERGGEWKFLSYKSKND